MSGSCWHIAGSVLTGTEVLDNNTHQVIQPILFKYLTCFRACPSFLPLVRDFPVPSINPVPPFSLQACIMLDPFLLCVYSTLKTHMVKSYLSIFICSSLWNSSRFNHFFFSGCVAMIHKLPETPTPCTLCAVFGLCTKLNWFALWVQKDLKTFLFGSETSKLILKIC